MPKIRTSLGLLIACLVCGMLLWVLNRPLMHVDRQTGGMTGNLFALPLRDIDYLMIERNGYRAELKREAEGWMLTHPVSAFADQTAVQRLLDSCERAPLRDRIESHELNLRALTLADFGLLEPQARLVVAGPRARAELMLGNPTSTSNELFACFMRSEDVLLTDLSLLAALPESLYALSDSSFFRGDLRRVGAVGLRRPGLPFLKFVRSAGGWNITQPFSARADDGAVAAILGELAKAKIARFVWPTAGNLSDAGANFRNRLLSFGLDDADAGVQIQLWMAGDPVGQCFRLGTAVDGMPGHVHALAADGVAVVAVTNAVLAAALQPIDALRDKRLFAEAANSIWSVSVTGVETPFSLRRDASGTWALTSPVSELAEPATVSRLLDALLDLKAAGFETQDSTAASTGHVVCVDLSTRQTAFRLMASGDAGSQAPFVRLAFTNDATVYRVPTSRWSEVAAQLSHPVAFRNRTLFKLPAEGIRRITVQRADGMQESVEHDRGATGWRSASPERSINRVSLDAWLNLLADVKAERVETLHTAEDPEQYGLSKPYLEVTIDLTAEDALRRVLILGGKAPGDGRFAFIKGHDTVFVLGPAAWRQLDQVFLRTVEQPVPTVDTTLPPSLESL